MTSTILDVSVAQGTINWPTLAASKRCDGVIVKATEGNGSTDRAFFTNFAGARDCGLLLGTYHFAHPDTVHACDPEAEAAYYVATVKGAGWDGSPLLFALDIEEARNIHSGPEFVAWVRRFCERVDSLTGLVCWIYSGGPFIAEHAGKIAAEDAEALRSRPFWIAAYVNDPTRYVALTPWAPVGATLHQWSGDVGPGNAPGIRYPGITANVVDTSRFAGTIDELRDLIAPLRPPDTLPAPAPSLDDGPSSVPTVPGTPPAIRRSSQRIAAVNEPIIDNGAPVTPIRAGEGEHAYDPEPPKDAA